MPAAKAHPYLVSFGHIGLVEQERDSGRYALGPLALQMGLISLQQADPVRLAAPLLPELAARTGQTVALVVWGSRGPTIVLREASPSAVHVDMRHGTVFSIVGTASGRLFAAFLPVDTVRPLYDAERRAAGAARARRCQCTRVAGMDTVPSRARRSAASRPRSRRGRGGGRRERDVGTGVRPPRRDGAGASPRSARRRRSTPVGRGRRANALRDAARSVSERHRLPQRAMKHKFAAPSASALRITLGRQGQQKIPRPATMRPNPRRGRSGGASRSASAPTMQSGHRPDRGDRI